MRKTILTATALAAIAILPPAARAQYHPRPLPIVESPMVSGPGVPYQSERGSIQRILDFLKEKQIPIRYEKSPDINCSMVRYQASQMGASFLRRILADVPARQIDHAELYEKNGIQTLDLYRWNAIIMRFVVQ